jgi:MFS family permease
MTVTSKVDITRPEQRGLATGFNEFFGYAGVAIAGIFTGYLATEFDPRWSLFSFCLAVVLIALTSAYLFSKETLPWAKAEAAAHKHGTYKGPKPRFPKISESPSAMEVFTLVSFRNRTFLALSQAGCVEKFVDALVWAFFPIYFLNHGLTVIQIGWIVGVYGMVWGASQLWTGPLSDAIGRKMPIVIGMWICGIGVMATLLVNGFFFWMATAALMGLGMALLYPTLIAAVGDISHPNWRGSSLGTYRFWRDTGYGIGALSIGLVAEMTGNIESGFILTAIAMGLSGLWTLIAVEETNPMINPEKEAIKVVNEN